MTTPSPSRANIFQTVYGWGGFDSPISQRLTSFFALFSLTLTVSFTSYLAFTGFSEIFLLGEAIPILMLALALFLCFVERRTFAAYLTIFACYLSLIWGCLFLGPDSNIHSFTIVISILPMLLLKFRPYHLFFFAILSIFCFLLPVLPLPEFFAQHHLQGAYAHRFRAYVDASTFLFLLFQGIWFLRLQAGSWQVIEARSNALKAALHFRKEITQVIAHDVKEPLATLLLGLRIAQKTDNPEEIKRHLSRMEATSLNIHRVLDYLLSLAIAEQEASELLMEKTEFSIRDALRDLQPIYQSRLDEKQLRLNDAKTDMDQCLIYCNRDTFTFQILSNLIGNASRAAPPGSSIEIRLSKRAGGIEFEIENLIEDAGVDDAASARKPFGMKIVRKFCDWNQIRIEQIFESTSQRHRQSCRTRLLIPTREQRK
jgi:signal transduction histidine kinase